MFSPPQTNASNYSYYILSRMYGCVYMCVCVCVGACVCVCVGGGACVSTHIKISYRLPKYFHFSLAFISSHNTMETLQKKAHEAPKNVRY